MHTECKTSVTHHRFLYDRMEELLQDEQKKTSAGTDLVQALHEIAEQTHRRSLVVLFSDMLDGETAHTEALFEAMQHLKYNKHEVILFHVHDGKTEMEFEFENRPYTFVDPETGAELKVQPGEVKENYVKAVKAHRDELKLRCEQYHIDFIPADIQEGFDKILIAYLIKRSTMR